MADHKNQDSEFKREHELFEQRLPGKVIIEEELKKTATRLERKIDMNTSEIRLLRSDFEKSQNEQNAKLDKIIQILEGMTRTLDELKTDKIASELTFLRHENKLDNREDRIIKLESSKN